MGLTIQKNKINHSRQVINFVNHHITLIGENGCGKSSILEAIFQEYIDSDEFRTICFSSGQNELFSNLFSQHKKENKRYLKREENKYIKS